MAIFNEEGEIKLEVFTTTTATILNSMKFLTDHPISREVGLRSIILSRLLVFESTARVQCIY